ncbi:hypothetical protein AC625_09320 [Peribacillus loiseleuriae]|uniref:Uncharacterized protein n=1 Tax=Peribacillus loiseleuriae TaxID=1679170 RepID=A0A0K9GSW9_9BACI|nr:hypothetical protein AC625_09320 [Peribacillus loiseleuriae]
MYRERFILYFKHLSTVCKTIISMVFFMPKQLYISKLRLYCRLKDIGFHFHIQLTGQFSSIRIHIYIYILVIFVIIKQGIVVRKIAVQGGA